ncbi:unnamed protein product [Symbiodinium sp. CCMP2456]|nr:unnamed protein product [Symbiodinium sp. CCMP2456]
MRDESDKEGGPADAPALAHDRSNDASERLLHFDGVRTVFALWIVFHHMAPRQPSLLDKMLVRVDVCVEFFVLLSGFMTHYAYHSKDIESSFGSLAAFFVRRCFRCLLASYLGMVLCTVTLWLGGFEVWSFNTLSCFLLIKTWIDPEPNCPNMPSWFLVSMLPSWLLYPMFRPMLGWNRSMGGHVCLAVTAWCFAIVPQLCLMLSRGAWLEWTEFTFTWFWPPALLPDFMLGACVAALVLRKPPCAAVGWIGDLSMLSLLLTCTLVPVPERPPDWGGPSQWRPGHYIAWEQLSARLSAPFLCTFIYYTSNGNSLLARILSQKILVRLGRYTLEVYLLQTAVHDLFLWIRAPGAGGLWPGLPWTPQVFLLYLCVLWLLCAAFAETVAEPLTSKVKTFSAHWVGRTLSQCCEERRQQYQQVDPGCG